MLMSNPRLPRRPSIRDIDRDIVACEVALTALDGGTHVLDPDRECLSRKLSQLLELRRHCERHGSGVILRLVDRG